MGLMHVDPQVIIRFLTMSSEGGDGFGLMEVHPGTLIWTLIIFAILVVLLGK